MFLAQKDAVYQKKKQETLKGTLRKASKIRANARSRAKPALRTKSQNITLREKED